MIDPKCLASLSYFSFGLTLRLGREVLLSPVKSPKPLLKSFNFILCNYVLLNNGTHSEKCIVRRFCPCANIREHLHEPRWYAAYSCNCACYTVYTAITTNTRVIVV